MQKRVTQTLLATLISGIGALGFLSSASAQTFNQQEISDPSGIMAVAAPVGNGDAHGLLVIEQISNKKPCWSVSGANPTIVNPLWLTFDFTGICNRLLDSNGYSIRMAGQDLGLTYSLGIVNTIPKL
jgi:hypothetical protein